MTETESGEPERNAATLSLHDAIFREADGPATPSLSLHSAARRVGLLGDWQPLFRTLMGDAQLSSGRARFFGCDIERALARGSVGFAPCDPPLPESFSMREYLEHAARLGHGSLARAKTDAQRSLEDFGLVELAAHRLGTLALFQRRALGIALAALNAPPVVCLETPLRGLDAAAADYVARLCAHVAQSRRLIVSAALPASPSPERTLLDQCDELFLRQRGALVAHGSPETIFGAASRYLLTFLGSNEAELVSALNDSGCQLTQQTSPTSFAALLAPGRRVARYLIELPPTESSNLVLDRALGLSITVLELEPLLVER